MAKYIITSIPQNKKLNTFAGGGEYKCAYDEKWDKAKQKCVKIVQNLSEATIYDPEGKKIQTTLFQKLKDAKDAYQNFTKQHRGKKYRLNEADSASSIEQLIKGIQLYKDEYAKEQESTRAELKKLENLKSKAALKNNKDIQNLSLKDLNTVKGKMKIDAAIRNSDLDSGTIAALYKGFNLDTVDPNVMKEGYKGQWQDAVNEANARKEANMGITNTALELFGGGAYRVVADPLGTLKGVGQTAGDIATLPFGLATGVYNYATDGNFDMGTNAWGDSYGKGLSQTGDVLSAIPGLGAAGKLAKFTKAADLAGDIGKGFKTIGTKLDQKIYPTRAYRSEGFAVDPERFSTTDNATKQLAEKVGKKGDWATKDLEETYQYLRGLGFDESQGLLSGKNVKFTEYKLPFWKKDISADPDVIALKKLQGTKINSNEYIVPGNTALDRFLYPRRTNIIKGIPEHVKSQKIYPSKFPEGIQTYYKGTIPMNVESETLSSPAYKYVEDQLNAVTGHEMPITHEWNSNYFPIKDWQQPQFAPNEGVSKFTRFSSSLPGSPNASISDRLKQFFDRPPGPMMLLGPSGGTNMVKKNIPYYEQLLNTYDSKVMSATNKKFYKDLINTAKMQDGMLTEAQLRELDRLKTGNFDFGKKGYAKGGITNDYIEIDIPEEEIQKYIDGGYIVEEVNDPSIPALNTFAGGGAQGCPPRQYWNGTKCTKLITLKDDKKYIDGVADWRMHVSDPNMITSTYNDNIKNRLYSGKWGFDPESGALVKLSAVQPKSVTTLDAKTKADREREKKEQEAQRIRWESQDTYRQSIIDAGFDPATFGKAKGVNTITGEPIYASSKEEADRINQEAINQAAIEGNAAIVNNPVFKAAAYMTPWGMAIGAMEGAARLAPDTYNFAKDPSWSGAGAVGMDALMMSLAARGIGKFLGVPKQLPGSSNAVDFSKYLTQEEAVAARAQRLISQKNKPGWNEQLTPELETKLNNAVKNHNPASEYAGEKLGSNTGGRSATEVSRHPMNADKLNPNSSTYDPDAVPIYLNDANKARVAAHETGHYYSNSPEEGAEWLSHFNFSKLPTHKDRTYLRGNRFNNADEIRERAAQLKDYIAQKNGIPLNQDFKITQAQLDDAIKNYVKDTKLDNTMSKMLGALTDKKGLLKTMNKYPLSVIPIVGVAGTATMLANPFEGSDGLQQQKKGGATKNFIELELPKNKIQDYINQGYIVEEID